MLTVQHRGIVLVLVGAVLGVKGVLGFSHQSGP